jgi:hypothetical protein
VSAGTARVNGSAVHDALSGIAQVSAYGAHDTLIGGASGWSYLNAFGLGDTLIGGTGGITQLRGHATGSTLIDGPGTSQAVYVDDGATINLSTDIATETGSSLSDTLVGLNTAVVSGDNSKIIGDNNADMMTASGNNDTLLAGTGGGTLNASGSSDTYQFGNAAGSVIVNNGSSGNTTASNTLAFGTGLTDEKLWFVHSGNDLVVDLLGTTKSVTVKNWFSNTYSQLQGVTAGGLTLDTRVNQLVQAMATYSAAHSTFDPTTATVMPTDSTLQTAITTSWH